MGDFHLSAENELRALQREIDEINLAILDLLSHRGKIVLRIGRIKSDRHVEKRDTQREEEQIRYVLAANNGPYSDETVSKLFRLVFHASLNLMLAADGTPENS